jgi:Ca2+-binding RTX toxin-like protein
VFSNAALGHDTIAGFDPAQDAIVLSQTQLGGFSQLKAHASATPDGTLIALNSTQSILFAGVPLANLHASNFQFV